MPRIVLRSLRVVLGITLIALTACGDGEDVQGLADTGPEGRSVLVSGEHSFVPDAGYVPDEETATRIADAVLVPVYGSAWVDAQRPLSAQLSGGVWRVTGRVPLVAFPDSVLLEISKADGRIVSTAPEGGYVPDAETAVRIAEAVQIPVYGRSEIEERRPFRAALSGDVWRVLGSLPPNMLGGTGTVDLARTDARIIRLSHGM